MLQLMQELVKLPSGQQTQPLMPGVFPALTVRPAVPNLSGSEDRTSRLLRSYAVTRTHGVSSLWDSEYIQSLSFDRKQMIL